MGYVTTVCCENCGANQSIEIEYGTTKEEWKSRHLDRVCYVCKCKMFDKGFFEGAVKKGQKKRIKKTKVNTNAFFGELPKPDPDLSDIQ